MTRTETNHTTSVAISLKCNKDTTSSLSLASSDIHTNEAEIYRQTPTKESLRSYED